MNGLDGWKTFWLGMTAIICAAVGSFLNVFTPEVFSNVTWAVLGAYGFKSAVGKIAASKYGGNK